MLREIYQSTEYYAITTTMTEASPLRLSANTNCLDSGRKALQNRRAEVQAQGCDYDRSSFPH